VVIERIKGGYAIGFVAIIESDDFEGGEFGQIGIGLCLLLILGKVFF
jgi:hypothetical protein